MNERSLEGLKIIKIAPKNSYLLFVIGYFVEAAKERNLEDQKIRRFVRMSLRLCARFYLFGIASKSKDDKIKVNEKN